MKRLVFILVLIGLAGGGYYGYRNFKAGQPAPARAATNPQAPAVPVEVGRIETATVNEEVQALGTLAADESVVIAPEIAGRVVALGFKEGDRVQKGQELVKLDKAILDADLKQSEADLRLARDTYERNRALVQRGSGTQVALEQATAQLASSEARVQLAQSRLALTTIVAPFTGVVGLRSVGVGDFVPVGKELITLTSVDPIKVDFRVPELYLASVKVGQSIEVKIDALPDSNFTGKIYAIDPVVDINGRAIKLRAMVPNGDLVLKPGLFARISIIVNQREKALIVPETAIVPDGTRKMIYIVEDGKAKRMTVEIGKRMQGKVEITKGLNPAMQIVTTGQMRLRDGVAVAIKNIQKPIQTSATE